MMVLDTHIWFRWLDPNQSQGLPASIVEKIATADRVVVSSISCLEIAWLVKQGKIKLNMPLENWFELALEASGVELQTANCQIALLSTQLADIHKDPADRIILATAEYLKADLISFDQVFKSYPLSVKLISE